MRKVFLLVVLAISLKSYCQIPVKFEIKDYCNDSLFCLKEIESVSLKTGQITKSDSLGYFRLNKGETYFIGFFYSRGKSLDKIGSFNYNVKSDFKVDTIIKVYRIDEFVRSIMSDPVKYYNCMEECNGFLVDYYPNGVKRLEGKFRDGFPIGKLIFYNPDGSIQRIERHKWTKPKYRY